MKSLLQLYRDLLYDVEKMSGVPTSRDYLTIAKRVENEGDSFLTITLPLFQGYIEECIREGKLIQPFPRTFKVRKTARRPVFLQGLLDLIFDVNGALIDDAYFPIRLLRQVCSFAKKIQRACSDTRVSDAYASYIKIEEDLSNLDLGSNSRTCSLGKVFDVLTSSTFPIYHHEDFSPRHGPGATKEKVSGNQKFSQNTWISEWDDLFPPTEYLYPTSQWGMDMFHATCTFSPHQEQFTRVIHVPKTLKTPRIIAVEPVAMQYMQQALSRAMVSSMGRSKFSRGRINFDDQTPNFEAARKGSIDGGIATIDLSEASDRVSLSLVELAFRSHPQLLRMLELLRSPNAKLPDGRCIPLRKFASMGSALTFPVESYIFFGICVFAGLEAQGLPVTSRNIYDVSREILVFGDDIVTRSEWAPVTSQALSSLGLKVNERKSFWTGKFRESCGGDFFNGMPVKPVYLRKDLPTCRSDADRVASTMSTSNQLFEEGYYRLSYTLYQSLITIQLSIGDERLKRSSAVWSYWAANPSKSRWNKRLQKREFLVDSFRPSKKPDVIDGLPALRKSLSVVGLPTRKDHLTVSERPYGLALNRKWTSG